MAILSCNMSAASCLISSCPAWHILVMSRTNTITSSCPSWPRISEGHVPTLLLTRKTTVLKPQSKDSLIFSLTDFGIPPKLKKTCSAYSPNPNENSYENTPKTGWAATRIYLPSQMLKCQLSDPNSSTFFLQGLSPQHQFSLDPHSF